MLFYVVGKISTHTVLESGFRTPFDSVAFKEAFAANYGGTWEDYYIYSTPDTDADALRVQTGEEWVAVWTDDQITGISFAPEEEYKIMRFEVRDEDGNYNDTLIANGVDYLDITTTIWDHQMQNMDTSFNGVLQIPLIDPDKVFAFVRVTFSNGVAQKRFKTTKYGIWNIPNKYKFPNEKIMTTNEMVLDINALMDL